MTDFVDLQNLSVGVAALVVLAVVLKVGHSIIHRFIEATDKQAEEHRKERQEWMEDACQQAERTNKVLEQLEVTIRTAILLSNNKEQD